MALVIGLAASVFTAVFVSHLLFDLIYGPKARVESISIGSVIERWNAPYGSSCKYQVAPFASSDWAALGTAPLKVTVF